MHPRLTAMMMAASSAGGGGGGVAGTIWDDEFNVGSAIDTAGTRFAGAKAWTKFGTGINFVSESVTGGEWVVSTSGNGTFWYPHGADEGTLPAGDWEFTTDCHGPINGFGELFGLYLSESGSGKSVLFGPGMNNGSQTEVRVSSTSTNYARTLNTWATEYDAQVRVARVGANLIYSYSLNSGGAWTTLLTHAQTVPFTTAPDRIGLARNHAVPNTGTNASYFRWFRKTA